MLLEYALGEERSFLWRVGGSSLAVFELPGAKEIERAVRGLYALWSEPPAAGGGGEAEAAAAAAAVSRMLLAPAWGDLGGKRLAIVADGALHYLPFASLPVPAGEGGPLLRHHEVVELPSASSLAVQRRQLAGRPPAPELALVVADPVFDARDPRVRAGRRGSSPRRRRRRAGRPSRASASRDRRRPPSPPSPRARSSTRLDFDASRTLALSRELRRYRVVHFATHGIVDAEQPALSGPGALAGGRTGRPGRTACCACAEIYDLDLAADLVVLSGCRPTWARRSAARASSASPAAS